MQDTSAERPESFFARHATGLVLSVGLAAAALVSLALRVVVTFTEYGRLARVADPEPADGFLLRMLGVFDPIVAGMAAASLLTFVLSPRRVVKRRYRRVGAVGVVAAVLAGAGSAMLIIRAS